MGKKLLETLYTFSEWFYRIFYLNVLWIIGTILGFGFAGFFPAVASTIGTLQKLWEKGDLEEIKVFSLFKSNYKNYFVISNTIGYLISGVIILLISDLFIITSWEGGLFFQIVSIITFFILISVCMFGSLVFFVIAKFDLNFKSTLKQSFLIAFAYPGRMLLNGSIVMISVLLFYLMPILSILGGVATVLLINTWVIQDTFKEMEKNHFILDENKL